MDVFTKLLAAAASKLSAGQRTRLQWNDGSVCCLMDPKGEYLYCVVTTLLTYPERLAYQLLYDFIAVVSQEPDLDNVPEDGLGARLGLKIQELVLYYEDPKNFPQFAATGAASRESLMVEQSSHQQESKTGRHKLVAIAVAVLILAVLAVVYFNGGSQSVAEAPAAQVATFLAPVAAAHRATLIGHFQPRAV